MENKSLSEQIFEACGVDTNIYGYPDFENNNNNFVELLELPLSYEDIDGEVVSTIFSMTSYCLKFNCKTKVEFLTQLLNYLQNNKTPYLEKQIKQAIRQAEWEV